MVISGGMRQVGHLYEIEWVGSTLNFGVKRKEWGHMCRSGLHATDAGRGQARDGAPLDVTGVTALAKKARKGRAAGAWGAGSSG